MFNLTEADLEKYGANHTTREIHHQPSVWEELAEDFFKNEETYKTFLHEIYDKHDQVRVIMTGAGTSAFVGDVVVPELSRQNKRPNVQFEAIPTTDIVSNPTEYLFKEVPTILVSYARSGNSPESVASVALGQQIIDDFYQVVITCNKEGKLAENIKGDENSITLLMPERSNDKSLAMTSSYSSMVLGAYALFTEGSFTKASADNVINVAQTFIDNLGDTVDKVVESDFDRVVYLGSGLLAQMSKEGSLKMLELSGGEVVTMDESSLGFRHGPKAILNDSSLVVIFMSQDPYTRKYDLDILRELAAADSGMKIAVLSEKADEEVEKLADWFIPVNADGQAVENDFNLSLVYVTFAQVLALKKSIDLGITPDNPSPDGAISRVVKGVTIYDY